MACCLKDAGQRQTRKKHDIESYYHFAGARSIVAASWGKKIGGRFRNVLFNTLLQALGCVVNIPTITVAHKLADNIVALMGR